MVTTAQSISIFAGNTAVIKLTVLDKAGIAFPVEDYICTFIIKVNKGDSTSVVEIIADPSDIIGNIVYFRLTREDTANIGTFWFEALVSDEESEPLLLSTVAQGRLYAHQSLY